MKIINKCHIINLPGNASGGLDGISIYNSDKKQIYSNNITNSIIKNNYNDIKIIENSKYENIFIYHGKYDANWRHFILETFCSLRYFYEKKLSMPNLKILIPENIAKHTKEIIEIMDLQNEIIILKQNCKIFVDNIIIPDRNMDFNFINKFINQCKIKSSINEKKNIFISREHLNSKRHVSNYREFVDECIIPRDFHQIIPEKLYLADQITLINNADNIISLIGACCENIIFINSTCKFIILYSNITSCWASQYQSEFYNSRNKCILLDIGIVDTTIKYDRPDKSNSPWIINIKLVNEKLVTIL